jgi:hypothetical protein
MKTQDKETIRFVVKTFLYVLLGIVVIFGAFFIIEKARDRSPGGDITYFTVDSLDAFGRRASQQERRENLTLFCTPVMPEDAPDASESEGPFILLIVENNSFFGQRNLWTLRHDLFEEGRQYWAEKDAKKEVIKAVYSIDPDDLKDDGKDSLGRSRYTVRADKVYAYSKPEIDYELLESMRERQIMRGNDFIKDLEQDITSTVDSLLRKGLDPKTVDSLVSGMRRRLDALNRRFDPGRFDSSFRQPGPPPRRDIDPLPDRNPGQRRDHPEDMNQTKQKRP